MNASRGLVVLLAVSIVGTGSARLAIAAEAKKKMRPERIAVTAGDRWLGIVALPVDDALKTHLGLDERVIVQHVVPASPAARAGIQRYDILLKYGETEIHSLQDLVRAVEQTGEREATVTLLREGHEQSVALAPQKMPGSGMPVERLPELRQLEDRVARWLADKGSVWRPDQSFSLRFFGPGFVGPDEKLPSDLSITLHKQGDKPVQITVRRLDEQWEVSEDELQELPDDVRPHVERLLGRGNLVIGAVPPPAPHQPPFQVLPPDVRNRFELRHEGRDKTDMEQLRKELQQLRKDVEALREQTRASAADENPEAN